MSELYLQSSNSLANVISRLNKLNSEFDRISNEIRTEHKTLTSKWEGDASTAFHDKFQKQEPNLTLFHDTVDEYEKALSSILAVYERAEQSSVNIASN